MPLVCWARDMHVAVPRLLAEKRYHTFISHQWGSAQDQARALKSQLVALSPGLRCFLDVDDLESIGALEDLVDATDVMVVFLSGTVDTVGHERSEYMHSRNCLRELRTAVEKDKPIVFVLEIDPLHGAVDMATHRRDCPDDLRHALDAHPVVPWFRVRAFAQVSSAWDACMCAPLRTDRLDPGVARWQVSLTKILERILGARQGGKGGQWRDAELCIPGSIADSPAPLRPPQPPFRFHLYASPHNAGAGEVCALLAATASQGGSEHGPSGNAAKQPMEPRALKITQRAEEAPHAQAFLLYLHETTFRNEALVTDIREALARGTRLLLVHEQRDHPSSGGPHGTQRGSTVPFRAIIASTPRELLQLNIYSDLAVPLQSGDRYQRASVHLVLIELDRVANLLVAHPMLQFFALRRREQSRSERSMAELIRHRRSTQHDTEQGRSSEAQVQPAALHSLGRPLALARWLSRLRRAHGTAVVDKQPLRGESEMAPLGSRVEVGSARI